MTDIEIVTLAKIREALGIGHTHMLYELPGVCEKLRIDAERYRKLRGLNQKEFPALWQKALSDTEFDAFIDSLK